MFVLKMIVEMMEKKINKAIYRVIMLPKTQPNHIIPYLRILKPHKPIKLTLNIFKHYQKKLKINYEKFSKNTHKLTTIEINFFQITNSINI